MKATSIPHLEKHENGTHLIVHDEPFLILGGELHNSSMSCARYMQTIWPRLKEDYLNTVLGPVAWQDIEPEEDHFDFDNLDEVIKDARDNGLHLILLWFGSFKNGVSTYVPNWVKTNPERFPRMLARTSNGCLEVTDVLTTFGQAAQKADAKAFARLMQHVKEIDEDHSTVIMVQVENEIGLLGDSRDRSEMADAAWEKPVPKDLVEYILADWDQLTEQLRASLSHFKATADTASQQQDESWKTLFGDSPQTEELFMSYHYALYVEEIARAGHSSYALPLFTNCWQSCNAQERDSDAAFPIKWVHTVTRPGMYPSGGPNINVLDIWQKFCPTLQCYAPDMYLNRYESSCEQFQHRGQPLMVVEQRRDPYGARRTWKAVGSYGMMGVSPFGIDSVEDEFGFNPYKKYYEVLSAAAPQILQAQRRHQAIFGFYFDEPLTDFSPHDHDEVTARLGDYEFKIKRAFVFGKASTAVGIIIALEPSKFLFLGWGYMAEFSCTNTTKKTKSAFSGILSMHEMEIVGGTGTATATATGTERLRKARVLNGDEQRGGKWIVMPNEKMEWGDFPIAITIPGRTGIAQAELYSF